jgi:terminase large subunit-like protein
MKDKTVSSVVPVASQLKFTEKQKQAKKLLPKQRHTLLVGGSRSGKTTLLVHEIAERAVCAANSRHAILRLHANAARASIALDTLPKVFRLAFPGTPLRRHRSEGYFSLENGSEIWIGGLGDQDQVEKILGKEYATILLNETSQIPYSSVLVALTRLAQVVDSLRQAAFYDLNPTGKGHWTNVLFGEKRDPISRLPLADPGDYARMFLNPSDNAANLSADYLKSLENLPERQRRRFFEGVYVDDLDGALFSYEVIARARVAEFALARCRRVVVAVDPSGASGRADERADEIGIIVAGRGDDGHAYVLADRSLRDAPAVWGRASSRPITNSGRTGSSPRKISAARWCALSSVPPTPMRRYRSSPPRAERLCARARCRRFTSGAWCITSAASPCLKISSAPSPRKAIAARAVPITPTRSSSPSPSCCSRRMRRSSSSIGCWPASGKGARARAGHRWRADCEIARAG